MSDPDAALVPLFKTYAMPNPAKSAKEGRPIFDDMEVVEIRAPGTRNYTVQPAHVRSHWAIDPYTGGQIEVTYAQRFRKQYEQFREHATQTKSGTPLDQVAFLTEARRAELRAFNIYTVEALALVEGTELKNLGYAGRDLKNQAIDYLAECKKNAPNTQLQAELEALRARNSLLEEDFKALQVAKEKRGAEAEFDDMTNEQLRDYIEAKTGQPVQGQPVRRTLVRAAMDLKPSRAA